MFGSGSHHQPLAAAGGFGQGLSQLVASSANNRKRIVQLCKFGVGDELVAVFQTFDTKKSVEERAQAKTLVFDRVPSPAFEELHTLGGDHLAAFTNDRNQLLATSKTLRSMLADALARSQVENTHNNNQAETIQVLLSCWRALEIQFLDRTASLRKAIVDWANEFHTVSVEIVQESLAGDLLLLKNKGVDFLKGEVLLLKGKGIEAADYFKRLVARTNGHERRFLEGLAEVCVHMPGQDPGKSGESPAEWALWRRQVSELQSLIIPDKDVRQNRLVNILLGDIKVIAEYFRQEDGAHVWRGRSWPRLLAVVLLFNAPTAERHVLGQLANDCVLCLGQHDLGQFEGARLAFNGKALEALQKVYNYDSWAEAHIAEILSRCGAIESPSLFPVGENEVTLHLVPMFHLDFRQFALIKYVGQLAVGPGRVFERPLDLDWRRLQLAMMYLMFVSPHAVHPNEKKRKRCIQVELYARLILDRAPIGLSESFARKVFELCEHIVPWHSVKQETKRAIVKTQMETWLRRRAYQQAMVWLNRLDSALLDQELNQSPAFLARFDIGQSEAMMQWMILERALESLLNLNDEEIIHGPDFEDALLLDDLHIEREGDTEMKIEFSRQQQHVEPSSSYGKVALYVFAIKNKLSVARRKLKMSQPDSQSKWFLEYQEACTLTAKVASMIPIQYRLKVLRKVFIDSQPDIPQEPTRLPSLTSAECLNLMNEVSAAALFEENSSLSVQLRAILTVILAQAVKRGDVSARHFMGGGGQVGA